MALDPVGNPTTQPLPDPNLGALSNTGTATEPGASLSATDQFQRAGNAVLLAQTSVDPTQTRSAVVNSSQGAVTVTETRMRVVNPDRSVSEVVSWQIQRSNQTGVPLAESGLGLPQSYLDNAAAWLRFEGNLNGLPPRSVVVGINATDGGAYIARWHGTDTAGSGRLGELQQLTQSGWQTVPPEVFAAVPPKQNSASTRQSDATDLLRLNATRYDFIQPSRGQGYWVASYIDAQGQRNQVFFNPDLQVDQRHRWSTDSSQGYTVSYGPGHRPRAQGDGTLEVPQGGRIITSDGGASVVNANGDVRTNWVHRTNDPTRFDKVETVAHLYVDGRPTDWRVTIDHRTQTASVGRVDPATGRVTDPIPAQLGADGSIVLPDRPELVSLQGKTLAIATGARVTLEASTQQPVRGLVTREVPLDASALRFSELSSSPTQRAGYGDDPNPPWQTLQVEVASAGARDLGLTPQGNEPLVRGQVDLLAVRGATDRYITRDGVEVIAFRNSATNTLSVQNINTDTRVAAANRVTEFANGEHFLVPSFGRPAHEVLAELNAQGLEPVAVLGTGFIDDGNSTNPTIGYHYFNPSRLQPPTASRTNAQPTEVLGVEAGGKIRAGYWVGNDGRTHLLDFSRQLSAAEVSALAPNLTPQQAATYAGRDLSSNQVKELLTQLTARPDVVTVNLYAHQAAQGPEDLLGVMSTEPDRGQPGFGPEDQTPTNRVESRSFLAFDRNGELLGRVATPPVAFRDTMNVARSIYGERAAYVLNGDGDFYTKAWYADGREGSNPYALGYENAWILVRPTANGQPGELRELTREERAAIADYDNQEGFWDNVNDAWKLFERDILPNLFPPPSQWPSVP
jgi:hypothetical protein